MRIRHNVRPARNARRRRGFDRRVPGGLIRAGLADFDIAGWARLHSDVISAGVAVVREVVSWWHHCTTAAGSNSGGGSESSLGYGLDYSVL
jgi:hypothetical protein